MNITDILTTELINFIEKLRFAGYNIGTAQHIAAQDLILTLATQGKLPSELSELRLFLAPILCHSPTEQAEFESHFDEWLNQFNRTQILADTTCTNKTKTVEPISDTDSSETSKTEDKTEDETEKYPPKKNIKSLLDKIKIYNTLWKWLFIISTIVAVISAIVFILNM
jgi:uncharacterized protein with von Willebrand factor type A (vWA) domain